MTLDKTLPPDTVPPSPSFSTTPTTLSSTKIVFNNFEYKNTDNFQADIHYSSSTKPSPSTTTERKGEDKMDETITALKDLEIKELDSQQGVPSLATSSHSVSSKGVSIISTTNATCGDDDEMPDAAEQPFLPETLRALKTLPRNSDGASSMGSENYGSENDESLFASSSGIMAVDDTTTQQVPFSPETNAADAELAETTRRLGRVPMVFRDHSNDGRPQTYMVTLQWAIDKIGPLEFEQDGLGPRKVLRKDSDLRLRGLAAGLNPEMHAWLTDSSAPDTRVFHGSTFVTEDNSAISYRVYLDMYRPGWH